MNVVEKVLLTMLSLIALYLVLANSGAFDTIIKSLTAMQVGVFGTLQGRTVNVQGVSVGGGGSATSGKTFGSGFSGGLGPFQYGNTL